MRCVSCRGNYNGGVDTPQGWFCPCCYRDMFPKCANCDERVYRYSCKWDFVGNPVCDSCYEYLVTHCADCGDLLDHQHHRTCDGYMCDSCIEQYAECDTCGDMRRNVQVIRGKDICELCLDHIETWDVGEAIAGSTFNDMTSRRCFGVEVETENCGLHSRLYPTTQWGSVYECSTRGYEFVSPILQGDEGLASVRELCDFARHNRWSVDHRCGLHIHLDVRDLTPQQCLNVAYAYRRTYSMWTHFVTGERARNSMCGSPQYTLADIRRAEHIEDFAEMRDRFEFVNWRSYFRHNTVEVRFLHGSLDPTEICNWVKLHALFIDAVKDKTYRQLNRLFGTKVITYWAGLCQIIPGALTEYWQSQNNRLVQVERACEEVDRPAPEVVEIPAEVASELAAQMHPSGSIWNHSGASLSMLAEDVEWDALWAAYVEQHRDEPLEARRLNSFYQIPIEGWNE